jgi:anaerobic magnesium-protoporphyrin IX monomethyl ester cyclase
MKVLFYYPPLTPRTGFPTWEPLQFIFLTRVLREYHIDSSIIDGRLLNREQLLQAIAREISDETVCFGITALTCYQLLDALDTARYVKEHYPDIPVIVGGWHATLFPEETLREQGVDIVVRGQGEKTLPEVLERIVEKKDFQGVPGVSWKRNGSVIHEQDRPLVSPDLLPPLQASDFEKLTLKYYQLDKVLFYMSSVGCPYSCNYCSVNTVCHRKWLPLSAEKVFEEIRGLQNAFGFREVIFWDNP